MYVSKHLYFLSMFDSKIFPCHRFLLCICQLEIQVKKHKMLNQKIVFFRVNEKQPICQIWKKIILFSSSLRSILSLCWLAERSSSVFFTANSCHVPSRFAQFSPLIHCPSRGYICDAAPLRHPIERCPDSLGQLPKFFFPALHANS